jgi:hypothetical protein
MLYYQGKIRWYPLDRRLGGPQNRSGCVGEEKHFQPPPGIELYNPDISSKKLHVNLLQDKCIQSVFTVLF